MKKGILIGVFALLLIISLGVGVKIYSNKSAENCIGEQCETKISKNYSKIDDNLSKIENKLNNPGVCGNGICEDEEKELICPQCEPMPGKTSCPTVCHVSCQKDCDNNNYYLCESDNDCTTDFSCIEKTFVSKTFRVCVLKDN
ncbi:MAG: hypothetical protein WC867_01400 [Candidatus Pacearchaeota archaeon]|jgi:hypothetical protein